MDDRGSELFNNLTIMSFVDNRNVLLMDNFLLRFMNNWNMFLMHVLFLNHGLNMLMDDVLVVLVDYVSMSLLNNVLMMFMDDALVNFSDHRSFVVLSYNSTLLVS